jgi:hypothetical protein
MLLALLGVGLLGGAPAHAAPAKPAFTAPSRADDPEISGTGTYATEPATIVDSHGARYVANQLGSQISVTYDGGRTWTHPGGKEALTKHLSGCSSTGGDVGDVELAADQAGRTYFADLQITTGGLNNGIQPVVATSDDGFRNYAGQCIAKQPFLVDREWMAAYTPPGKTSADSRVYMTYHDFGPDVMWVNSSKDGGKTWGLPINVITDALALENSFCDTIPAGVAVDPRNGWVYVAWAAGPNAANNIGTGCNETQDTVFNNFYVAVSKDEGATWHATKTYTGPDNTSNAPDDMSEIFGSIGVDRQGGVYVAFIAYASGEYGAYTQYSEPADGSGALHFGAAHKLSDATDHTAYYVRLVPGDRGRVDYIYLGTRNKNVPATPTNVANYSGGEPGRPDCQHEFRDPGQRGFRAPGKPCEMSPDTKWYIHLVQSLDADSAAPHFTDQLLRSDPVHYGDLCNLGINCLGNDNRTIADVNDVRIDATGGFQTAYTHQDTKDRENEIDFQCQTAGPGLYAHMAVRSCRAGVVSPGPEKPVSAPGTPATGGNGTGSGSGGGTDAGGSGLASTGLSGSVAGWALLLLGAALVLVRRRSRAA